MNITCAQSLLSRRSKLNQSKGCKGIPIRNIVELVFSFVMKSGTASLLWVLPDFIKQSLGNDGSVFKCYIQDKAWVDTFKIVWTSLLTIILMFPQYSAMGASVSTSWGMLLPNDR